MNKWKFGFVIFIWLLIKYLKKFFKILKTKWRRNSCAIERFFFGKPPGLAAELHYIFI